MTTSTSSTKCPPASFSTTAAPKAFVRRVRARATLRRHILIALARRDPWVFLTHFCRTLDSHDPINPIKRFPPREYLFELTVLWMRHPLLVVAKSRQMMATWLFVCLYLWDAITRDGRLIFLQSKREEDAIGSHHAATGLLGRTRFVLERLPPRLRPPFKATANKIEFLTRHSAIWAIPQGADVIRQHTASGILSDEMAFQVQAEETYTAAIPTIENGGRFTAISTANPGFFHRLYTDDLACSA